MSKKYITIFLGILALTILLFALFYTERPKLESGKLPVVASFYPLYFFAHEIGGEKADVLNVTPAGIEPHDYEPSAQDMARIENSRLLIENGGVEVWADKVKQNLDPGRTIVVTAGEGLMTQQVFEEAETIIDPHVWLSPPLAMQMVANIEAGFVQADPVNALYYQTNARMLTSKLSALDQKYKRGLAICKNKNIVTSHAAFGYLATTYGLKQIAITGVSPDSEPSAKQLAVIAQFAKDNKVTFIFFESLVSPKLSQTIAHEVGAQTLALDPLEGVSDDEVARGKNYFTEMEQNLLNLKIALECSPD